MELRQLRYLVAVAQQGHFTRAAATLHIAQSALSSQIQRLERELGAELLVRDRRGVRPTTAGELVLARAQRVLAEIDGALADVQQLEGLLRGRVHVGAMPLLQALDLPELLAAFHDRHPGIDVRLQEGTADDMFALLLRDALDASFVSLGVPDLPPGLAGQPVGVEELVIVSAPGHRLAGPGPVALKTLGGEALIAPRPGSALRRAIDAALAAAGVAPRVAFESNDPAMKRALAARGLGVGVMPRSFVVGPGPAVAARPIAPTPLFRSLTLAWRVGRHRAPAARAFLRFARATLARPPHAGG